MIKTHSKCKQKQISPTFNDAKLATIYITTGVVSIMEARLVRKFTSLNLLILGLMNGINLGVANRITKHFVK